jgi:endonuclease YncB( thermonuclease family)
MGDKWTVPATVLSVYDGDTVHLDMDLGFHIGYRMRVRVVGIDAPELATAAGVAAKAYAGTLLKPGDEVTFVSHSLDKWGRPLGAIKLADLSDFGQAMIDNGHAKVLTY